ncbi:MAG TPA: Fur family transcriptional regulator [Candidatus Saccharimonadales bacterium]|nr:Fur family transcriptional regulator [Candidatus Saccharimonadales bacterium]
MDTGIQKVKNTLKEAHSSATKGRLAVFSHLATAGPMSVGELAHQLQEDVDRATVYRTVELYEKLGIVNRIWHGFKHQVELSEIFTPHHHHALCQQCGKTIDITSPELEAALTSLAKKHHFLTLNHSVELTGYCSECQ